MGCEAGRMAGCQVALTVGGQACQAVGHDDSTEGPRVWLCHRKEQLPGSLCDSKASD